MEKTTLNFRDTTTDDLDALFSMHGDPEGLYQAAFTPKDPTDKAAFLAHWEKCLSNPTIINKTVWSNQELVGTVDYWLLGDQPNISYWIDQKHRGQGLATSAVQLFLQQIETRPLFARVAFDNIGSKRVLEKCGFQQIGEELFYANARKAEIKELIFRLD